MNHMNEISQLLDNIITCGESMAKIGRLLKEFIPEFADVIPKKTKAEQITKTDTSPAELPEKAAEPAPAKQPKKEETPAFIFTDVRKAFSAKSHAGYTAQVKELISKYGAQRLSDVKEEDYPALMADLEVIG